jgi:transcriptional regulator with XRE-family HTH domain
MEQLFKVRLREWRDRHRLTLDDLSGLTGYDPSALSRIERGLLGVTPLKRVEIARRLGVSVADIFPPGPTR